VLTHDDIRQLLSATPFVPFRLHLSEGNAVEVRHRELAFPGRRYVIVGLPDPKHPNRPFDLHQVVSYMHVARVEMLSPGPAPLGPSAPPGSSEPSPSSVT